MKLKKKVVKKKEIKNKTKKLYGITYSLQKKIAFKIPFILKFLTKKYYYIFQGCHFLFEKLLPGV